MVYLEGCRREALIKNIKKQNFIKLHVKKPQDFLNNGLWTDETIVKCFWP